MNSDLTLSPGLSSFPLWREKKKTRRASRECDITISVVHAHVDSNNLEQERYREIHQLKLQVLSFSNMIPGITILPITIFLKISDFSIQNSKTEAMI